MRQDVARLMMCGAGGSPSRFFYGQGGKSSFMGKSSNFANIHNYDNNEYFFRGRNHGTDDENSQPNQKTAGGGLLPITQILIGSQKPRAMRGALPSDRHTSRPWQSWQGGRIPKINPLADDQKIGNEAARRPPEMIRRQAVEPSQHPSAGAWLDAKLK